MKNENCGKNKLAIAALMFIANYLVKNKQKQKLSRLFTYLDQNCDGVLSRDELKESLDKYIVDLDERERILDKIFYFDLN